MADGALDEIRTARRELDEVIAEIRAVPGFSGFLAPPTFDDVARAAEAVPIVYLAAADQGGMALVVRVADVSPVELSDLTVGALRERVAGHLASYDAYREDPQSGHEPWRTSLDEICSWLWNAVLG